jgi:hypothetical protein
MVIDGIGGDRIKVFSSTPARPTLTHNTPDAFMIADRLGSLFWFSNYHACLKKGQK